MAKPTKKAVLEAIKGSGGIMSTVASRLSVDWNTARTYTRKWEETKDAWEAEREKILDLAESTLFSKIKNGDSGDAKWLLARLGKDRGYSERVEQKIESTVDVPQIKWADEGSDTKD